MTSGPGPCASALYERIEGEIHRCNLLTPAEVLADPRYTRTQRVDGSLYWQPKAAMDGVFAETAAEDPIVGVSRIRLFRQTRLYVRFRLKGSDDGPIRCVVIINGEHSIRVAIAHGRMDRRRTYAETILDLDERFMQADALHVEVLRGNALLRYAHLKTPKSIPQIVTTLLVSCIRIGGFLGRYGTRLRPTRVRATRLLEESVVIRQP